MWPKLITNRATHGAITKFNTLLSVRNLSYRMVNNNKLNDSNCKNKNKLLCEKSETSCKMPLLEIDEHHEDAQRYFRKIGKMPKRDIWIPLDYIHRMDYHHEPPVYEKTWKECPRVIIKKAICTAEEIICPKDPHLPARFAKDVESDEENTKTITGRGMCDDRKDYKM